MILSISAKCGDLFSAALINDDDKTIAEYDGFVPVFMQSVFDKGIAISEYLTLDIDATTGQIIGWIPITEKDINYGKT